MIKKQTSINHAILILSMLFILFSCSTDSEYNIPDSFLNISVNDEGFKSDTDTRAVTPVYEFKSNDELSMFVVNQNTLESYDDLTGVINYKSTYTGNNWNQTVKVGLTDSQGTVLAFYPYADANSDPAAIPVTACQTDYLYGMSTSSVSQANTNAVIKMKHVHTLVRFKFTSEMSRSISEISISQMPESGTINLSNGVFTPAGTTKEVTETNLNLTVPSDKEYDYTTYVLPGNNLRFKFIIDGKLYFYKPGVTLRIGKAYNVTLKI